MIKNNLTNKKAFTLIEVLIAVLVLTIGLVGSLPVFARSNAYITEIQQHMIASQAAKEQIELIRNMSFNTAILAGGNFTPSGFTYLASTFGNPTGTITVDDPYASADTDMKRVSVKVAWNTPKGRALNRSLVTLITRNGINKQ